MQKVLLIVGNNHMSRGRDTVIVVLYNSPIVAYINPALSMQVYLPVVITHRCIKNSNNTGYSTNEPTYTIIAQNNLQVDFSMIKNKP